MIDTDELRRKISSVDIVDHIDIHANVKSTLAELLDNLEEAEKERDWNAERLEDAIEELTALRAKIEGMEKQKPVATVRINVINGNPSVDFVPGLHYLHHNDKLYALPGAKGEEK